MSEFTVTRAVRKAVPILTSLSGTSGSGKTFSGLLLAAGIAGGELVGMIDAENGRGTLYEDDPVISAALPNGYAYVPITPPYTPGRYVEALKAMETAGVKVCLIDSTTHEWEGEGGCCDIAENNKLKGMPNWAKAKREHKKFLSYCLSSPMHIIFCLRARDKVKIVKDEQGKEQFVSQGITPIAEKNFVFEMLVSLLFDEATHQYTPVKVPKMLAGIFKGGELITIEHGTAVRKWADGGEALGPAELLQKRARSAAELGMAEYSAFFAGLTLAQKKALADLGHHASNKAIAEQADRAEAEQSGEAGPEAESGDADLRNIRGLENKHGKEAFFRVLGALGHESIEAIPSKDRSTVYKSLVTELEG